MILLPKVPSSVGMGLESELKERSKLYSISSWPIYEGTRVRGYESARFEGMSVCAYEGRGAAWRGVAWRGVACVRRQTPGVACDE